MFILASDFSGIGVFLLAGLCLILMAGLSYIGSARGHWSGPLLASPLLLGVVAYVGMCMWDAPEFQGVLWVLFLMSPLLVMSICSIALWVVRRKGT